MRKDEEVIKEKHWYADRAVGLSIKETLTLSSWSPIPTRTKSVRESRLPAYCRGGHPSRAQGRFPSDNWYICIFGTTIQIR